MIIQTMRGRLLASSMITGAALLALGAPAARAADSTSEVTATATSQMAVSGPSSGGISTLTASTDATATAPSTVTEIVVTGSRIPQPNLTSVSPIQAVGHTEFQMEGHTDVIDLLNQLPQNFQIASVDYSNTSEPLSASGGITTADLRGLGPQRTLVLVDGRRLGIGDPNTQNPNPAPDLDQIPVAMIDHVEVLTGGASATYGSDAIAGVVNFVMKTNFEGLQVDGTFGGDEHTQHNTFMQGLESEAGITPVTGTVWDGANTDFSVIFGSNSPDDKGNVTGYFEFKHLTPVTEGARDFSDCLYSSAVISPLLGGPTAPSCTGSENSNYFSPQSGPNIGQAYTVVGNQLLPWPQAGSSPPAFFNSSPYEYLQRDDTRYLGGFFAHYDVAPWAQPYAEFMFMDDRTSSEVAPSGAFTDFGPNNVNCNNPLLSAQEQTALCGPFVPASGTTPASGAGSAEVMSVLIGRRNIEGGPRIADFDHTNYRIVLGVKGDFADDVWHYDGYGSYYNTSDYTSVQNYLSLSGIQNALLVNPVTGQCENTAATGCIPWDIFQTGGVTPQQVAYLTRLGTSHGETEEAIFEGNLRGDLGKYGLKSPWATDGVAVDFGTQHRWDHLVFSPDEEEESFDLSGYSPSEPVNNAITVQEEYFETRIPIAQKQPFAEDLYIDGGVRYSDYSTSGGVTTYKFGGQWSPIADFTLRGSFDHAIRAASIIEAYTPVAVGASPGLSDPCAASPGNPAADTLTQCERTGVTPAEYGNGISPADGGTDLITQCAAAQCSIETGGNPALKPEVSNSWSVGGTFQPTFLRGFTGSIDYWDIQIAGEIGTIPQSLTLNNCLDGIDTAVYCPDVVRKANGDLFSNTVVGGGYVVATNLNIGAVDVSGIDFQFDYHLNLEDVGAKGVGSLLFHFTGTYQVTNKTTPAPGLPTQDCAGLFGPECNVVDPRWRHIFSVTWNTPWNVMARLQWRYIGESSLDNNSSQPALSQIYLGELDPADATLPARSYLDLSGSWRVNTVLTVRAGITNLLDQDPPLISQLLSNIGSPNTYPTYDLLGRQLFISATAKF